ncbi:MAG: 3'(2'),5'-bisphosphate nucleotidase [Planctomycetota bacterium]|jgi:3'(2'), 5'-bisphosphate nucleotidase
MPLSNHRLRIAVDVVGRACNVARAVQRDLDRTRHITKDDRSPVTVADYAAQAIVALDLRQNLGDVHIVGEEHAGYLREPDHALVRDAVLDAVRCVHADVDADAVLDAIDACDHDATAAAYWTLDPVDGTKGFLRGQQYAIALAYIERGRVVQGVLGCPNLPARLERPLDTADDTGVVYAAAAGGGAWEILGGDTAGARRVHVATLEDTRACRVCESVERAHSKQSDTDRILEVLGRGREPVRLDSQCKYAVVARGQADAYMRLPTRKDYIEKIWDHAAGSLIAIEAGATVSDVSGRALDFGRGPLLSGNRGVICAVPDLHGRIIEIINELGIGRDDSKPDG